MSVKCSGCGKVFESNAPKFCDDCGTALATPNQTQFAQPAQPKPQPQPRPQMPMSQPSLQTQRTAQDLPLTNAAPNPGYAQSPHSQYGAGQQGYYAPPPQYNGYQPQMPPQSNTSPLSVGGFMITQLVLMIPLVGFIMAIVWAVGGQNTNVNRTNFCRSYFIWMVIGLVVGIIGGIIMGAVIAPLITELITEMTGSYGASYYW